MNESRSYDGLPLKTVLNNEEVARLVTRIQNIKGVKVRHRLIRSYPSMSSSSHLIGHIGRISKADQKQLEDITIAGESIGAVLASTVAIKIPSKVEKVYCFNPYDYDTKFGEGVSRGNFISKFLFLLCEYSHLPSIGNKSFNLSTAVLKPSWIPHEVENNSY